jgi:hypothetical protein
MASDGTPKPAEPHEDPPSERPTVEIPVERIAKLPLVGGWLAKVVRRRLGGR